MSKLMKIYLVVVTVFLLFGVGLGVYVWYTLQEINSAASGVNTPSASEEGSKAPTIVLDEPIIVETSNLPASQQKVLDTLGLEGESFTITQSMVTCAEDAVGAVRMQEILGGSAPSPLESLKLLPCMKR